ncbi:MAG: hypothetical protein KAS73_15165 [Candidatus Sabulitectum sp.]|nr:hypothetical protein [Candidatus Sabulitectum sp.]
MIPLHQTQAVLAAALLVVDKRIGGVLLRGASGTGKSELLQETERYIYSVRIPLGADSAALTGSIDLDSILRTGQIVKKPGLLSKGTDKIIVMEHLDLFKDSIQDIVLESGMAILGTVSAAGDIRGRMLDKFGLCTVLHTVFDPEKRLRVLVSHFASMETSDILETALLAKNTTGAVSIPAWFMKACAFTCSALETRGFRGDIALFRSSVALAALLEEKEVTDHHLRTVAYLALGHRSCGSTGNHPLVEDITKSVSYAIDMARRGAKNIASKQMQELTDSILSQVFTSIRNTESRSGLALVTKDKKAGILSGLSDSMKNRFFREVKKFSASLGASGIGRAQESSRMVKDPVHGRPVRSVPTSDVTSINPLLSVKAAAMAGEKLPFSPLKKEYWRKWEKSSKPRVVCMLAVDGSRSSQEYLKDLGIMLDGLFNKVFDQSSRVGLSAIKNGRSVILFPPVRNRLRVFGRINELQPHGTSPLDELLALSAAELKRISKSSAEKTFIILISDCYPEPVPVGDIWNSDIYQRVRKQAVHLGRQGLPVLVVDPVQANLRFVEDSPGRKLGRFIAHATGGNLISFGKQPQYDIFGALKEDHSKPKFIAPIDAGTSQGMINSSLGSLFDQMTTV